MATTPNETFSIPTTLESSGTAHFYHGEQVDLHASNLDPVARFTAEAMGAAAHQEAVGNPAPSRFDTKRMEYIGSNVTYLADKRQPEHKETSLQTPEATPGEIIDFVLRAGAHVVKYRTEEQDIPREGSKAA